VAVLNSNFPNPQLETDGFQSVPAAFSRRPRLNTLTHRSPTVITLATLPLFRCDRTQFALTVFSFRSSGSVLNDTMLNDHPRCAILYVHASDMMMLVLTLKSHASTLSRLIVLFITGVCLTFLVLCAYACTIWNPVSRPCVNRVSLRLLAVALIFK
jgi:hypothetical protein